MPPSKKSQPNKETPFQRLARWLRNISITAIFIFMICYVLGAFLHFGLDASSYLQVAVVNAVLLTGVVAIVKILRRKKGVVSAVRLVTKLLILFAVIFTAGYAEYYVINHQNLYWIILALLAAAMALSVFEFWTQLKTIWRGKVQSREKTLVQFIYLYVTTMFAFAFLYTILNSGQQMFSITYPFDDFFDFLYLSIITVSTLGYGDIIPITPLAKFLVMIQTIVGYLFLSILLGLMVSWLGTREK